MSAVLLHYDGLPHVRMQCLAQEEQDCTSLVLNACAFLQKIGNSLNLIILQKIRTYIPSLLPPDQKFNRSHTLFDITGSKTYWAKLRHNNTCGHHHSLNLIKPN